MAGELNFWLLGDATGMQSGLLWTKCMRLFCGWHSFPGQGKGEGAGWDVGCRAQQTHFHTRPRLLPCRADCWPPGECARCPGTWGCKDPSCPSPGVPSSSNPVLPRDAPPALAAGGHTDLENRHDGESINQGGESEDLYSLLGNLFTDSIKYSLMSHREWPSPRARHSKVASKDLVHQILNLAHSRPLWCPMGMTIQVIIILRFILWEHQRDWDRSWTHCAHGKGSSMDHKLPVPSVYEGPASPLLDCSTSRVFWAQYFLSVPCPPPICAQGAPPPDQGRNLWPAPSLLGCPSAFQQSREAALI